MALRIHVNNFSTTLSSAALIGATSLALTSTTGLPALSGGNYFYLTLTLGSVVEIVKVTAWSGLNLTTVVRAQESTSAAAWLISSLITCNATANSIDRKADLDSPILTTPALGTPASGILTNCTGLTVTGGGTGVATMTTAYAPICAGATATGALQVAYTGLSNSGWVLTSTGASSIPTFQAIPAAVSGPVSSTNNGVVCWNGTGGATLEDSTVTIASGILTTVQDPVINTLALGLGGATGGTHNATNTALGVSALAAVNNATAANVVAVGYHAGLALTTGATSVFMGSGAGAATTTPSDNVYIGYLAATAYVTRNQNVVIGSGAGGSGTGASSNVYIGYQACKFNSNGNNVAIGANAGSGASAQFTQCTAIGVGALSGASATGASNTAVGYQAGIAVAAGTQLSLFGELSGAGITSGSQITAVGWSALTGVTTAGSNTGVGRGTGVTGATGAVTLTTGLGNTLIGDRAGVDTIDTANAIALGRDAVALKATGTTTITFGPGLAIGSAAFPVGFRGDGTIIPSTTDTAGSLRLKLNGTQYNVPLYVDAYSSYSSPAVAAGAVTIAYAGGTFQQVVTAANTTITLPTPIAGKIYRILVNYGGTHTITWVTVSGTLKWAGGSAPVATSTAGHFDIYELRCIDASNIFGSDGGRNF